MISILLGALVGLERAFTSKDDNNSHKLLGGVRTFSLLSFMGCLSGYLDSNGFPGAMLLSFIAVILLTSISYFISYNKENERGITTEISILVTFCIGIIVHKGHYVSAVALSVLIVFILYLKKSMDALTRKINQEDIRSTLKFLIITFIILPLFDPHFAFYIRDIDIIKTLVDYPEEIRDIVLLNPWNVWLMVVLISGISFTGYCAIKIIGPRRGLGISGLLGGLVSSTATAITFSRKSKDTDWLSDSLSFAVIVACSTMFPRVLFEVAVLNATLLKSVWLPIVIMTSSGFAYSVFLWKKSDPNRIDDTSVTNPFNIFPAVKFAILYSIIVFATRLLEKTLGDQSLFIISFISGLADVDAITITLCQISRESPESLRHASTGITLATFANTLLKASFAIAIGSHSFRKRVAPGFIIIILSGVLGLFIANVLNFI